MNLEKTSKGSIKVTSQLEFILLMACLMSIVALSIDTILPALKPIGSAVGTTNANENQLLITMIFLGLGFGQLIFGPISDSFGRKPVFFQNYLILDQRSIDRILIPKISS